MSFLWGCIKINRYIFNCTPFNVSPTVFSGKLSYLEEVYTLKQKINELIAAVEDLYNKDNEYTDEQIKILRNYIDNSVAALYNYADNIQVNLISLIGVTADELKKNYSFLINESATKINERINKEILIINSRITNEINKIKDYIDNQVIDIRVINPLTGKKTTIQNVLNALADLHKEYAFTAEEYDNKLFTAIFYDDKKISALEYDFKGKQILI